MKKISTLALFILAVGFLGCATSAEKSVNAKLAAEPTIPNRTALQDTAEQSIQNAANVTVEQKQKLLALKTSTGKIIDQANRESLQLRGLLIQELLSPKYNSRDVMVLKKKVRVAENKRIDAMLGAIDSANKILGRSTIPAEQVRILHNFADIRDY